MKRGGRLLKIITVLLFLYFAFILVKSVKNSLFIAKRDRLNLIFYGKKTTLVSLGLTDGVHYLGRYDNDLFLSVPGGYGQYRVGSLGRLASLEKKPVILQKTFSSAASLFVDFYFYPVKSEVFSSEDNQNEEVSYPVPKLSLMTTLFTQSVKTNANFVDRLYLYFLLFGKRKNDFSLINPNSSADAFFKKYQGYFYQKSFRNEEKQVKIRYHRLSAGRTVSRILEGEGIRVVDLSWEDNQGRDCQIMVKGGIISPTSNFLSRIFSCQTKKGDVSGADLAILLGSTLEKQWE